MRWFLSATLVVALSGCAGVAQRFPTDVQTSIAHDDMRKLETGQFILYYPASRRDVVDRFLVKADRCAREIRERAAIPSRRKFVVVMPDTPFNNAFVAAGALGYEDVAVIPTFSTLDFTTEFGLPPDPGFIACHELVHYVQVQQLAGFWKGFSDLFGDIYNPQAGYDPWLWEGLATTYEARLTGIGRPQWPIFTGMFAAAYAGKHISSGELSAFGRQASVGHHYLVGSMFIRFLVERYGERPIWLALANQARALTGWFFTGTFKAGYGVSFGTLLDEFNAWAAQTFPVRPRPPQQRTLASIGNDARYARGRDGTEAWVTEDVDAPARLVVRDAAGRVIYERSLVEVLPLRTLVQGDPLLVSGLSITADGREVWLTVLDQGATYQTPRLLRWRRGERGLEQIRDDLGPGATIDPTGRTYYYCHVDGDRWSLAALDLASGTARTLVGMKPGMYVLGAQISADGARLAANVWDGSAFAIWIVDAHTGQIVERFTPASGPYYDASFTSDGRVMWLGAVAGRFQVFVDGHQVTEAPYTALAPREAGGTIRFLDREGWSWELAEVALPPPALAALPVEAAPTPKLAPPSSAITALSDEPASVFDHFFYPQQRSPALALGGGMPHFGLVLGGGDRLGLQRWSIAGYAQPKVGDIGTRTHYGAQVGYLNNMLAPVSITALAGFLDWAAPTATDDPDFTLTVERRTRDASLSIAYTWRNSLALAAGGFYTDDDIKIDVEPNLRSHVGGPNAALQFFSAEGTRYTGIRRALLVAAEGAFLPKQLSTFSGDITDLGGSLAIVVPMPFGRRHTLSLSGRARALIARDDTGLLQLGGEGGFGLLWERSSVKTMPPEFDDLRFPPAFRFVEPLRGYEDYAITTDRAELGEATWKYPIIIDRGTAATLFLPASYLQQLDLALFGAGAFDKAGDAHYAVGGAVTLRFQFLRIPLAITYQIARRLVDDEALTQWVGVAPGI
ncbi:MAG: hypothetical protein HOV81_17285 [Kofleriaceae bacterium]|nr:hypothetical protein [Kofleriaceae bacterium]